MAKRPLCSVSGKSWSGNPSACRNTKFCGCRFVPRSTPSFGASSSSARDRAASLKKKFPSKRFSSVNLRNPGGGGRAGRGGGAGEFLGRLRGSGIKLAKQPSAVAERAESGGVKGREEAAMEQGGGGGGGGGIGEEDPTERPTEWIEYTDEEGKPYSHCEKRGETSWELPPEVVVKQQRRSSL